MLTVLYILKFYIPKGLLSGGPEITSPMNDQATLKCGIMALGVYQNRYFDIYQIEELLVLP